MKKLDKFLNEEILVHTNTNGKELCVAGVLREIRDDLISLVNEVKMVENGASKIVFDCTMIANDDIIAVSGGQKVINFR